MRAGEQKIASDGYEVCLFPCECMFLNVNRPEHDVYALDFLPVNAQGAPMHHMPVYAPFTGTIVYRGNDHNCILQSNNKVHTPNGLKYVRVLVAHSDSAPPAVTSEFRQGFQFYTTGNYADVGASFGEHLHMEYALVDDPNVRFWNTGGIGLYQGVHMWDGLYVDDTFLARPGTYTWLRYGDTPPIPTGEKKKHKFPWFLYRRKFEKRRLK